jgi:hypothetical protein
VKCCFSCFGLDLWGTYPFIWERQETDTLVSEEVLLLAKYLRNEKKDWIPRIEIAEKATENESIAQVI